MRLALLALLLLACGGETDATDVDDSCEVSCNQRELIPCRTACEEDCGADDQCIDLCSHDCQLAYETCVQNECT